MLTLKMGNNTFINNVPKENNIYYDNIKFISLDLNVKLTADNINMLYGDDRNFTVILTDSDGKPLTNNHELYYKNNSSFVIVLTDMNGNVLSKQNITFEINNNKYYKTTDENGTATLNINLNTGHYILTATNPINGEMHSNTVTVLPKLVSEDLTMKYKEGSQYKVKVLDDKGMSLKNEKVVLNINGKLYDKLTNENGIASLDINLLPGEYIITSYYDKSCLSNKITIY